MRGKCKKWKGFLIHLSHIGEKQANFSRRSGGLPLDQLIALRALRLLAVVRELLQKYVFFLYDTKENNRENLIFTQT